MHALCYSIDLMDVWSVIRVGIDAGGYQLSKLCVCVCVDVFMHVWCVCEEYMC